ncbi:MAG: GNAT family N-acetyltransferase [Planctomycetales bacterium]|nr:GNAT family N-acetyltransferase [Planctomycetales bacterium]
MNFSDEFQVREVSDEESLRRICRLRAEVWTGSGALLPDSWRDELDEGARHWAVWDASGQLVAAARLTLHESLNTLCEAEEYLRYAELLTPLEGRIAAPDRVVVAPFARNRGLADCLLELQEQAAQAEGARLAVRQASPAMCRLLVRRGWQLLGPATSDPRFPQTRFTVAAKTLAAPATIAISSIAGGPRE